MMPAGIDKNAVPTAAREKALYFEKNSPPKATICNFRPSKRWVEYKSLYHLDTSKSDL